MAYDVTAYDLVLMSNKCFHSTLWIQILGLLKTRDIANLYPYPSYFVPRPLYVRLVEMHIIEEGWNTVLIFSVGVKKPVFTF